MASVNDFAFYLDFQVNVQFFLSLPLPSSKIDLEVKTNFT